MRYSALGMVFLLAWACSGSSKSETEDTSAPLDGRAPGDALDGTGADTGTGDLGVTDARSAGDLDLHPADTADENGPEVTVIDQIQDVAPPGYCYDNASVHGTVCRQPATNCETMAITWGLSFELTLCLSDLVLHAGGCGPSGQSDLVFDWTAALVNPDVSSPWTSALVEAELWDESGVFLKTLTFIKTDLTPCPVYVIDAGPGYCNGRSLALDSALPALTSCLGTEGYNTIFGGCCTPGYVETPNGLGGTGIRINLPVGRYEIRLVFSPEYDSGPLSWPPEKCSDELPDGLPGDLPWPPEQQHISMWFEVVE